MSFIEKINSYLDKIGITNPSKTYTPFTFFFIFFSFLFNIDLLAPLLLSGNWEIQKLAIEKMQSRDASTWLYYLAATGLAASLAVLIFGLFQSIAACYWGLSDWINILVSKILWKHKYIDIEQHHLIIDEKNEAYEKLKKSTLSSEKLSKLENQLREEIKKNDDNLQTINELNKTINSQKGKISFHKGKSTGEESLYLSDQIPKKAIKKLYKNYNLESIFYSLTTSDQSEIVYINEKVTVQLGIACALLSKITDFKFGFSYDDSSESYFYVKVTISSDTKIKLQNLIRETSDDTVATS